MSLFLRELLVDPGEALDEAITSDGAGLLYMPGPVPELAEAELLRDLLGVHGLGEVALVGKDQQHHVLHLTVCDDAHQLRAGLVHTLAIGTVDHKDKCLSPGKVVTPQRTDLILTTDIL